MSSIIETAEIDIPWSALVTRQGYKCIGSGRQDLCISAYAQTMNTWEAVISYLEILASEWDALSDLERQEAVGLALEAAKRANAN